MSCQFACLAFDRKDGLTPEEEEERVIAKRKMLGNIKFIGELGKCGMLHESILHRCIQEVRDGEQMRCNSNVDSQLCGCR